MKTVMMNFAKELLTQVIGYSYMNPQNKFLPSYSVKDNFPFSKELKVASNFGSSSDIIKINGIFLPLQF